MTLTSLTGKSLKATRGARWCCLCHSQSVTDKHHARSINRLIALSLLPLQSTQSGRLVGVFLKMITIPSISEIHNTCVYHHTQSEMQTCTHKDRAHTIPGPCIADHQGWTTTHAHLLYIYKKLCTITVLWILNGIHLQTLWLAII